MKLRKLIDLVVSLIDLKPRIVLYSNDNAFCIEVRRNLRFETISYTIYDDPENPIVVEVEDLFDESHREDLEKSGVNLDSDWKMDNDDFLALRCRVNSTSQAFKELMEDRNA